VKTSLQALQGRASMTRRGAEVIEGILSRRDPQGYYVIPVKREALDLIRAYDVASVEEVGDVALVRVKSRRLARELASRLLKKGLLARL